MSTKICTLILKEKKHCATIILDGNLNCNTQPPPYTHTHLSHSFTQRILDSVVAIVIPKPITALNLSSLRSRKPKLKIAPIKFALVYRFSSLPCHTETLYLFTDTRYTSPSLQLPPILHPTWGRDSIINQFTSCERHPPEEGNEQWQMKDIGKQLLAATVGGCAPWHHLVCSWQRKQIAFFACACTCEWWIRDSEDEERWRICTVWVCCLCRILNNKWQMAPGGSRHSDTIVRWSDGGG